VDRNRDVELDWDDANVRHLARHKITRREVEEFFASEPILVDHEAGDGEDRWSAVGSTKALRVLVIVFTVRDQRLRPITGWDADRRTREDYFRNKGL
jgi:uncharacterized protein